MTSSIRISFRTPILQEIEHAARQRHLPVRIFVEQMIEATVASARLRNQPPSPELSAEERAAQAAARTRRYRQRQKLNP